MSQENPFDGFAKSFQQLTDMVVGLAGDIAVQKAQLSAAEAAIGILVASHPDKSALKARAMEGYTAMQRSAVAQENPHAAFEFEKLMERLFGPFL